MVLPMRSRSHQVLAHPAHLRTRRHLGYQARSSQTDEEVHRHLISLGLIGVVAVVRWFHQPTQAGGAAGRKGYALVRHREARATCRATSTHRERLEPDVRPRNITALTSGRVEDLPVRPGVPVTTNTVLVVLSNPDEEIKQLQNEQQLNQAVGALASLKTALHQQILSQQEGSVASMPHSVQQRGASRRRAGLAGREEALPGERRRTGARQRARGEAAARHREKAARRRAVVRAAADPTSARSRSRASSGSSPSRRIVSPR